MWEIDNISQLIAFLLSLAVGCVFCLIYDIFRAVRKSFKRNAATVFFEDILYALICGVIYLGAFSFRDRGSRNMRMSLVLLPAAVSVVIMMVNGSIGIGVAADRAALIKALDTAFSFAQVVLVERAIVHLREINCAVLGDRFAAEASECEEPVAADEILSFENKYIDNAKGGKSSGMASVKRRIPADIPDALRAAIRETAVKAFRVLGCSGVSRIDFMIDCDENKVYLNEINTIPGSLSFYLWEPLGVSYPELLERMISLGMKRHRERAALTFSFESNVLSGIHLGGTKGTKV